MNGINPIIPVSTSNISPVLKGRILLSKLLGHQNALAQGIVTHQLQNATHHVFKDPLRSFLELVVNSLDSSNPPEECVGKFGMGFLSILSFLHHPETNGCRIHITTTYRGKNGLHTYEIVITLENGQPAVEFVDCPTEKTTGTLITIIPNFKAFSKKTLATIESTLSDLRFFTAGKVKIKKENEIKCIGRGAAYKAWVKLFPRLLQVQDKGCGIPEEVARQKLFMPSSSTKTPVEGADALHLPYFVPQQNDRPSSVLFLIGGVIIFSAPLDDPLITGDLVVPLSKKTSPVLSRDGIDFILPTKIHLKAVIQETIDATLKKKTDPLLLLGLFRALQILEEKNHSAKKAALSQSLVNSLREEMNKRKLMAIPFEFQRELTPFLQQVDNLPLPLELVPDRFFSFENFLLQRFTDPKFGKNIIEGKTVIFVPDQFLPKDPHSKVPLITSFGFQRLLFAPLSIKERALKEGTPSLSSEQITAFILSTSYCEEGRMVCLDPSLQRAQKQGGSREIISIMELSTPQPFSMNHIPDAYYETLIKKLGLLYFSEELFRVHNAEKEITGPLHEVFFERFKSRTKPEVEYLMQCVFRVEESSFLLFRNEEGAGFFSSQFPEWSKEPNVRNTRWALFSRLIHSRPDLFRKVDGPEFSRMFAEKIFKKLLGSNKMLYLGDENFFSIKDLTYEEFEMVYFNAGLELGVIKPAEVEQHFTPDMKKSVLIVNTLPPLQELQPFRPYEKNLKESFGHLIVPLLEIRDHLLQSKLPEEMKKQYFAFVTNALAKYHAFLQVSHERIVPVNERLYPDEQLRLFKDDHLIRGKVFFDPVFYDQHAYHTIPPENIFDLFKVLATKPVLFERALYFSEEWLNSQLNIKKRDQMLGQKLRPVIPSLCAFNYLPHMVKLRADDVLNIEEMEILLSKAQTHEELYLTTAVLESIHNDDQFKIMDREKFQSALIGVLTYVQKLTKAEREEILAYPVSIQNYMMRKFPNFAEDFQSHFPSGRVLAFVTTIAKFITKSLQEPSLPTRSSFMEPEVHALFSQSTPYTTNQLLNGVQSVEFAGLQTLPQFAQTVAKLPTETSLNMVNQCVEHATDREYFDATLKELVQNAGDALMMADRQGRLVPKIKFGVEIVKPKGGRPALCLRVKDEGGMDDLQTLLMQIPNYSRKRGRSGLGGQMGNGSYQIYKQATQVIRKTRLLSDPSKAYMLRTLVLRNQKGEVYDLQHACIDISAAAIAENFWGTEISILVQNKGLSLEELTIEGLSCCDKIRNTLAFTKPYTSAKVSLYLNGTELQGLKTEGVSRGKPIPFEYLPMEKPGQQGVVLTGGYPYKPLAQFLVEEGLIEDPKLARKCSVGWCLNIPAGTFAPTQSRSKLIFVESVRKHLRDFVMKCVYLQFQFKESMGTKHFPHMDAEHSSFDQIDFTKKAPPDALDLNHLEEFFTHYKIGKYSFCLFIKHGYANFIEPLLEMKRQMNSKLATLQLKDLETTHALLKRDFSSAVATRMQLWKEQVLKMISLEEEQVLYWALLEKVVFPWFDSKMKNFVEMAIPTVANLKAEGTKFKNPLEIRSEQMSYAEALKSLGPNAQLIIPLSNYVLERYISHLHRLIPLKKGAPKLKFYYSVASETRHGMAFYRHPTHTIHLNMAQFKFSEVLELAHSLSLRIPPHENLRRSLVSFSPGEEGALNHEYEHARRFDSLLLQEDLHEANVSVLGQSKSFQGCATDIALLARRSNVYDRWSREVSTLLTRLVMSPVELRKIIEVLKICEHQSTPALMRALGVAS